MIYNHYMHSANEMKFCRGCERVLDVVYFSLKWKERDVRQTYCRHCARQVSRRYYVQASAKNVARVAVNNARYRARNRAFVRALLCRATCMDCGICDFAVLEFDDRDSVAKVADVSALMRQPVSQRVLEAELRKCDVVCANCHRRRTAQRGGWRKLAGYGVVSLPDLPKRGRLDYERIKSVRSCIARRLRNRAYLLNYLREHRCAVCGEGDPVVLDFDHVRDKVDHVTSIANASGGVNLAAELAKCQVLCANCHRRHTATQAGRLR